MIHQLYLGEHLVRVNIVRKAIRHSYLRVTGQDEITVTTSHKTTVPQILEFVKKHEQKLSKLMQVTNRRKAVSQTEALFFGTVLSIVIEKANKNDCQVLENMLFVRTKEEGFPEDQITKYFKNALLSLAKQRLEHYRPMLESTIDLSNLTLKVQKMSSQLGSCHIQKRVIKLSYALVFLDVQYLDAILLHELAHLRYTGHQADFYLLLTKWCPNYKELKIQIHTLLREIEV